MTGEVPDRALLTGRPNGVVEALLTEISIRSADQHLSSIAGEIIDRLRCGEFDAVDLSRSSDDNQFTLVFGIRWDVDGTTAEGRAPQSPA